VALAQALNRLVKDGIVGALPMNGLVAAVSVGVVDGDALLDLDYPEDSTAQVDFNVVMTDAGRFVELQGTAEGDAFERAMMDRLIDLGTAGIRQLNDVQRLALTQLGVDF
jgi:ribonuclease PH